MIKYKDNDGRTHVFIPADPNAFVTVISIDESKEGPPTDIVTYRMPVIAWHWKHVGPGGDDGWANPVLQGRLSDEKYALVELPDGTLFDPRFEHHYENIDQAKRSILLAARRRWDRNQLVKSPAEC